MPIFQFSSPNQTFSYSGGDFVASNKFIEINDNHPIIPILRRSLLVKEVAYMPDNRGWDSLDVVRAGGVTSEERIRILHKLNKDNVYPIPNCQNRKVLLLGRGKSAKGFQQRFPKSEFVIFAANPRVDREPNYIDLQPRDIDAIVSLDVQYFQTAASTFLREFEGAVCGPICAQHAYIGPGTWHSVDELVRVKSGQSMLYAASLVHGLGASEIHIAGCELKEKYSNFEEDLNYRRKLHKEGFRALHNLGAKFVADIELLKQWPEVLDCCR